MTAQPTSNAASVFSRALHELWLDAGAPSTRSIALRTRHRVGHTTVHNILNGRISRWDRIESVVIALNGDPNEFRGKWQAAWRDTQSNDSPKLKLLSTDTIVRTTLSDGTQVELSEIRLFGKRVTHVVTDGIVTGYGVTLADAVTNMYQNLAKEDR